MSSLAIPPKRVRLYRLLWDRWIIILRILFDLGAGAHPVRWQAVADILLVDKKTSQKYMAGLVRDGHLALAGNGYMLTEAGMEFLQEHEAGEFLPLGGKNPGETFSPLKESVVVVNDLKQLTPPPPESGKNPGEIFSPQAKAIIECIPDLFDGSQLLTDGLPWVLDEFQDQLLLGWVAYVWDKRTSLTSPVGLIYSKLRSQERPSLKYLEHPEEYLPDDMLEKLRLIEFECTFCTEHFPTREERSQHEGIKHAYRCLECSATFETQDKEREHYAAHHAPVRSNIETLQSDSEAGKAWQTILQLLQDEMPKASFDTWVRDTVAMRLETDRLIIGTRNSYARDWLTNRMTDRINTLLVGVVGPSIWVNFVVAIETKDQ